MGRGGLEHMPSPEPHPESMHCTWHSMAKSTLALQSTGQHPVSVSSTYSQSVKSHPTLPPFSPSLGIPGDVKGVGLMLRESPNTPPIITTLHHAQQ